MFGTEVQAHHAAAPQPSLVTSASAYRVPACYSRLPLPSWYSSAVAGTRARQTLTRDVLLDVPQTRRVTIGDRASCVAVCRVWNSLPPTSLHRCHSPTPTSNNDWRRCCSNAQHCNFWLHARQCHIFSSIVKCSRSFFV